MKATPDERSLAQFVASLIRGDCELWQHARTVSDWERYNRSSIIGLYICNLSGGNPARFLRLVAGVLSGKKLRGAPNDDLILQAIKKAIQKAIKRRRKTRKAGHGMNISDLCPSLPEIDAAYVDLTKAKPDERLTERQLRRRVEAFGYKRRAQDSEGNRA